MRMNPLFTLVKPSNYVVVVGKRVVFGFTLPLSKRNALAYAKKYHPNDHRVIMRKTAVREGIL